MGAFVRINAVHLAVQNVFAFMMMFWCFTSFSTSSESHRDNGSMIMKGSVQCNAIHLAEFCLQLDVNLGPHDLKLEANHSTNCMLNFSG